MAPDDAGGSSTSSSSSSQSAHEQEFEQVRRSRRFARRPGMVSLAVGERLNGSRLPRQGIRRLANVAAQLPFRVAVKCSGTRGIVLGGGLWACRSLLRCTTRGWEAREAAGGCCAVLAACCPRAGPCGIAPAPPEAGREDMAMRALSPRPNLPPAGHNSSSGSIYVQCQCAGCAEAAADSLGASALSLEDFYEHASGQALPSSSAALHAACKSGILASFAPDEPVRCLRWRSECMRCV